MDEEITEISINLEQGQALLFSTDHTIDALSESIKYHKDLLQGVIPNDENLDLNSVPNIIIFEEQLLKNLLISKEELIEAVDFLTPSENNSSNIILP